MSEVRTIYIGEDQGFYSSLEKILRSVVKENCASKSLKYKQGVVVEELARSDYNIVFVDLTSIKKNSGLVEEVVFLKKISRYKPILFAAIVGDNYISSEMGQLFTSGVSLCHVKGGDVDVFILDSLYIALDIDIPFEKFASSPVPEVELEVGVCSTLAKISENFFYLETDVDMESDKIPLRLNIFPDLEAKSFKVEQHQKGAYLCPMTECYALNFPFAGPWDEVSNENMQQETVTTWIESNVERFQQREHYISVITTRKDIYRRVFDLSMVLPVHFDVLDQVEEQLLSGEFTLKKPNLVFFEVCEENTMDKLPVIINAIKSVGQYAPILITYNNPSKAAAIQKVYGYSNIVCVCSELTLNTFQMFLQRFVDKLDISRKISEHYFKISDDSRALNVNLSICLTSINEHEVTFICNKDLPYYCNLHFQMPTDMFVTIVPSPVELKTSVLGRHYFGFIHGVSEVRRSLLRRFVNQYIFEPIEEFTPESIKKFISREPVKLDAEDAIECEEVSTDEVTIYKKPSLDGRSKL